MNTEFEAQIYIHIQSRKYNHKGKAYVSVMALLSVLELIEFPDKENPWGGVTINSTALSGAGFGDMVKFPVVPTRMPNAPLFNSIVPEVNR